MNKKVNFWEMLLVCIVVVFLFLSNVSNHNIYGNIGLIFLVFGFVLNIMMEKKLYLNGFFIVYLAFVGYQLILVLTGIAYDKNVTMTYIQTLLINLCVYIFLYNMFIKLNSAKKIINCYIISSFISLAVIVFLLRNNLFTSRLAHAYGEDSISFYFLGYPIAISSNGIAFFCTVSMFFSMYYAIKDKNKWYYILSICFILGTILTGSRKGLLLMAIYIIYCINYFTNRKYLKKMLIGLISFIIFYILITKVDALYKIMGERFIELIKSFMGKSTSEGSIVARNRYKNLGIELFKSNKIFGCGIGYFKSKYGNVTENNYLEMLVSGGIFGFLIYYYNYAKVIISYLKGKYKFVETKFFFIIILALLINEYGSVTYLSRTIIVVFVYMLSLIKIEKLKESKLNE